MRGEGVQPSRRKRGPYILELPESGHVIETGRPFPCTEDDNRDLFDRALDHLDQERHTRPAQAICDGCWWRQGCEETGRSLGVEGIWGGVILPRPPFRHPGICERGHDLTLPGATRPRSTGGVICRVCEYQTGQRARS